MAQKVEIDKSGNVTVDGVRITPGEVEQGVTWVDRAFREASNKQNWTVKNAEKVVLYVAGIAAATNGFGQIPLPTDVRGWVVGGAALVLAAVHISTPKAN